MTNNDPIILEAQRNKQKALALLDLCHRAKGCLHSAQEKMGSARNWGFVDMLGGGFITNLIKHSKLDDAMHYVHQAQPLLRELGRELGHMPSDTTVDSSIGSFAIFADFFFDGIFADVYMQSKIHDLIRQLEETLRQLDLVEEALRKTGASENERIRRRQTES